MQIYLLDQFTKDTGRVESIYAVDKMGFEMLNVHIKKSYL